MTRAALPSDRPASSTAQAQSLCSQSSGKAPKIYLAGPDVFCPDLHERFAHLEALCFERGLQGLRPSDGGVSCLAPGHGVSPYGLALKTYEANVAHIRQADAVVANLSPFRGAIEPDSGTVFEVGMAIALGKPVAVYLPQANEDMASRIKAFFGDRPTGICPGAREDATFGMLIEDFGLPLNLMIACSASVHVTPEQALDRLAKELL